MRVYVIWFVCCVLCVRIQECVEPKVVSGLLDEYVGKVGQYVEECERKKSEAQAVAELVGYLKETFDLKDDVSTYVSQMKELRLKIDEQAYEKNRFLYSWRLFREKCEYFVERIEAEKVAAAARTENDVKKWAYSSVAFKWLCDEWKHVVVGDDETEKGFLSRTLLEPVPDFLKGDVRVKYAAVKSSGLGVARKLGDLRNEASKTFSFKGCGRLTPVNSAGLFDQYKNALGAITGNVTETATQKTSTVKTLLEQYTKALEDAEKLK
jgi:hypothetical protein